MTAQPFGHGAVLTGRTPGDKFQTIARDRHVKVRSVPCPTCGAAVDTSCSSWSGLVPNHTSRRRMALRAEREAS